MVHLRSAPTLPLEDARTRLATVWFIGAGLIFLVLVVQSILGKYSGQLQEVWSWFVPTVVPSLALMLGVIGADALRTSTDERRVKLPFFRLSHALSTFYLFVLTLTVLLEPFSQTPGLQLFILSNYWLSPLQGLVVAAMGVLFASQEGAEVEKKPEAA